MINLRSLHFFSFWPKSHFTSRFFVLQWAIIFKGRYESKCIISLIEQKKLFIRFHHYIWFNSYISFKNPVKPWKFLTRPKCSFTRGKVWWMWVCVRVCVCGFMCLWEPKTCPKTCQNFSPNASIELVGNQWANIW